MESVIGNAMRVQLGVCVAVDWNIDALLCRTVGGRIWRVLIYDTRSDGIACWEKSRDAAYGDEADVSMVLTKNTPTLFFGWSNFERNLPHNYGTIECTAITTLPFTGIDSHDDISDHHYDSVVVARPWRFRQGYTRCHADPALSSSPVLSNPETWHKRPQIFLKTSSLLATTDLGT
jgi:hypothetical protein